MESNAFDPYRKWLGIPEEARPPTHYQLLGISPGENDRDVIDAAVIRQSAFVRNFQTGKHAEHATKLLNEIASAQVCINDPARRAQYDAELKQKPPQPSSAASPATGGATGPAARGNGARAPLQLDKSGQLMTPTRSSPAAGSPALRQPQVVQPLPGTASARRAPPARQTAPAQRTSQARRAAPAGDFTGSGLAGSGPLDDLLAGNVPLPHELRPPPRKMPAYYWQAPLALVVVVALIAIVAISLGNRPAGVGPVAAGPSTISPLPQPTQPSSAVPGAPGASSIQPPPGATTTPKGAPVPDDPFDENPFKPATPKTEPEEPSPFKPVSKSPDKNPPAEETPDPGRSNRKSGSEALEIEWPGKVPDDFEGIDVPGFGAKIVHAEGGPFVAVEGVVWDLSSGKKLGQTGVNSPSDFGASAALSPDGKLFAHAASFGDSSVEIRNCERGTVHKQLTFKKAGTSVKFIGFGEPGRLITAASWVFDDRVQIWNTVNGEFVKEFKTPDLDFDKVALSPDGKHLAANAGKSIAIYDVKKGKVAATIQPPLSSGRKVEALTFAPDGQELAALDDDGQRLLVWDGTTKLVFEVQTRRGDDDGWRRDPFYKGPPIEWLPEADGWLLYGRVLVERQSRRAVWKLKADSDQRFRLLDQQHLLVVRGNRFGGKLVSIKIPWVRIKAELADESSKHENLPFVLTLN